MKVKILASGRMKNRSMLDLISDYLKRCNWKIDIQEFEAKSQKEETQKYLSLIEDKSVLIVLDEKGKSIPSEKFADLINDFQINQNSNLTFIIGGAYGLEEEVRSKADHLIAFGAQTWPHMLVRIMLVEQIYRAEQILKNHPYHKP